jgi:hypothetical protein
VPDVKDAGVACEDVISAEMRRTAGGVTLKGGSYRLCLNNI